MKGFSVDKSMLAAKKLRITVKIADTEHHIWIGQRGAEDFTMHKDEERKRRYIARHAPRENWSKGGVLTPGFWARWLLWNKPTLRESIKDVKQRFFSHD
jgi:hypothetical protein